MVLGRLYYCCYFDVWTSSELGDRGCVHSWLLGNQQDGRSSDCLLTPASSVKSVSLPEQMSCFKLTFVRKEHKYICKEIEMGFHWEFLKEFLIYYFLRSAVDKNFIPLDLSCFYFLLKFEDYVFRVSLSAREMWGWG